MSERRIVQIALDGHFPYVVAHDGTAWRWDVNLHRWEPLPRLPPGPGAPGPPPDPTPTAPAGPG